jgi:CHASE3 domain sensor protein
MIFSDSSKRKSHTGLVLILVPLMLNMTCLLILSALVQNADAEMLKQVRAKAIISQANALSKLFYDAGVAMGGYSITKSPLFADRYNKICKAIPEDVSELKTLVGNNEKQQTTLNQIQTVTIDGVKILNDSKAAIDDNRVDVAQFRARHMYKQIRTLADQLQEQLKGLTEEERKIENAPAGEHSRARTMVKVALAAAFLLNIAVSFVLSCYNSRASERMIT